MPGWISEQANLRPGATIPCLPYRQQVTVKARIAKSRLLSTEQEPLHVTQANRSRRSIAISTLPKALGWPGGRCRPRSTPLSCCCPAWTSCISTGSASMSTASVGSAGSAMTVDRLRRRAGHPDLAEPTGHGSAACAAPGSVLGTGLSRAGRLGTRYVSIVDDHTMFSA